MKYLGSKRKIAKEIIPIILKDKKENQYFCDVFCGGVNVSMNVFGNVIANDISTPLISLYKALQQGWTPPKIVTEDDYKQAKLLDDTNPLKGYIGFNMSFACKYFGGFARDSKGLRDRSKESYNNVMKTRDSIKHIKFENKEYYDLDIPDNSIIYCDPPYLGTTGYKHHFNHDDFYFWCILQHNKGHQIFISEYDMPNEFTCIWQKSVTTNIGNNNTNYILNIIEKLYTIK